MTEKELTIKDLIEELKEYPENKRFTLEMQYWKGNPQGRKLFDNLTGQEGMSVEELCNIASDLHSKCEELESVLEVYEDCLGKLEDENNELKEENKQLKQQNEEAIDLILDGIMEMHDGKRDYAETLFNKAIKVIKNDT